MDKVAAIEKEIVETSNDIDNYLVSDVPLECYRRDIAMKLAAMQARIVSIAQP